MKRIKKRDTRLCARVYSIGVYFSYFRPSSLSRKAELVFMNTPLHYNATATRVQWQSQHTIRVAGEVGKRVASSAHQKIPNKWASVLILAFILSPLVTLSFSLSLSLWNTQFFFNSYTFLLLSSTTKNAFISLSHREN